LMPGPRSLTLLKVDPASTGQNLTPKPKEIEHCHDCLSISSCEFSPQSPRLTTHRTAHQFLVHRSDNNTLLTCFLFRFSSSGKPSIRDDLFRPRGKYLQLRYHGDLNSL
jgi:hypothetical protein